MVFLLTRRIASDAGSVKSSSVDWPEFLTGTRSRSRIFKNLWGFASESTERERAARPSVMDRDGTHLANGE
jgi:hypothetical protein